MSDPILFNGEFLPAWKTYKFLSGAILALVSVVGIPFLVLLLPLWIYLVSRQYRALSCEVTRKFLKYRKGLFVRREQNVPLEQITDIGVVEGPMMRLLGIKQLTIETAGQSLQGPLVTLLAVKKPEQFRDDVLTQRDKLRDRSTDNPGIYVDNDEDVQREILASLIRIEKLLSRGPL
ncbi:MAG: PH domain-containing protein [Gammaproteobacteria bacterium]|nr:PH domain-containing protein [Gammaproteobacteria bacterium]